MSKSITGATDNTLPDLDSKNEEKPQVLLLQPMDPLFQTALSAKFDVVIALDSHLPLPTFLSTRCQHIKVLLTLAPIVIVDSAVLDRLPSLGLVAASSAGVNHIDLDACRKRGIAVTNAGEMFTPDAADFAVGLLIDVLRRVTMADRYVKTGSWMLKGDYPLGSKVRCKKIIMCLFYSSHRSTNQTSH